MHLFLSLLLFGWVNVWGAELSIPALTSPVMDQAGFLTEAEKEDLSKLAYEIYTNKGPQITILTVPDLQDHAIEDFSIRVAEQWKLGTKKEGNGLLIVISKAERKMRIEVGEGIEGEITDFESNQYINKVLAPSFKQGRFHEGLRVVMQDIARRFNIQPTGESAVVRRAPQRVSGPINKMFPILIGILIFGQILLRKRRMARGMFSGLGMAGAGFLMLPGIGLGVIILFIIGLVLGTAGFNNLLFAAAAGSGRRGGFGGGGFGGGGGGWGGGGGGFSGGGSSGSW
ncbi:MAG TPA: TPM domain-containing protein [Bacteriovoracaceae bacterium]|nr:TPM domain-containing protein [Bacteriovoracaceae bacterium]